MTLALSKFRAFGDEAEEGLNRKYLQYAVFELTAATSDVTLDFGTYAGTLWTALSEATVLAAMKDIVTRSTGGVVRVSSTQLVDRVQSAAAGSVQEYALAIVNGLPNITVKASDGESTWQILMEFVLKPGHIPVEYTKEN